MSDQAGAVAKLKALALKIEDARVLAKDLADAGVPHMRDLATLLGRAIYGVQVLRLNLTPAPTSLFAKLFHRKANNG